MGGVSAFCVLSTTFARMPDIGDRQQGDAHVLAKRRSLRRAKIACVRKLVIILHRMWTDETDIG